MRILCFAILVPTFALLAACRGNDLGTGVNTMDREYSKPASEVCSAVLQCAEAADFQVRSATHDQLGGEIVASRGDGKKVRFLVKSLGDTSSRVSVRVEPGDRDLANLMHERIAGRLGVGTAKTGWWSGGNSLEGIYQADLATCLASARRTMGSLAQDLKDEESHATWCQIDGRQKDSTPVRIKMERVDDMKTRVFLIVGTSKSEDNRAFAQRMKDDFETTTGPADGSR